MPEPFKDQEIRIYLSMAEDLAKHFENRHPELIKRYARRHPDSGIINMTRDGGIPEASIVHENLTEEVYQFMVNLFLSPAPQLKAALRDGDIANMRKFLAAKCRSRFEDGARDPRFRAIRTVLAEESKRQAGTLRYLPGRSLADSARTQERAPDNLWGCFAFCDVEGLEVLPPGLLAAENYRTWPAPPLSRAKCHHDTKVGAPDLTQKEIVLLSAKHFWDLVSSKHGPWYVPIRELQRYLESTLPPYIMDCHLHDPADLNPPVGHGRENDAGYDGPQSREPAEDIADDSFGLPVQANLQGYETPVEFLPIRCTVERYARDWLSSLTEERRRLFCLKFYGYGSTEAAAILGKKNPQDADAGYKAILKSLKTFCSMHPGLSAPDCDPDMIRLFEVALRDFCEQYMSEERER